jgi:hypothetical protein
VPRASSTANLATLERVANVKKDLEVKLLAPVREIERRHLRLVSSYLRSLVWFAVLLVEVVKISAARA